MFGQPHSITLEKLRRIGVLAIMPDFVVEVRPTSLTGGTNGPNALAGFDLIAGTNVDALEVRILRAPPLTALDHDVVSRRPIAETYGHYAIMSSDDLSLS
jgi:hypothetical protein